MKKICCCMNLLSKSHPGPQFSIVFISIIIILIFIWIIIYPASYYVNDLLPGARHAHPQPVKGCFVICIIEDQIYLDSYGNIHETANLSGKIREGIEELANKLALKPEKVKVRMRIYRNTKWEIVVRVLKELKKLNIESIGLMTREPAFLHELLYHEARDKKNRTQK